MNGKKASTRNLQAEKKVCVFIAFFFVFSSCAWFKGREIPRNSPEALYQLGYEDYQKGRYDKAIASFQRLKEEYPLSELAIRAEVGIGDAYFSKKDYGYAEMAYNDFINLHPVSEHLPYVMYQIGMCHYNQMLSIDRDQTETVRAVKEFEKLIARFPTSKFSFLAEKNLRNARKQIAEHEYYVGQMYFRMKKYRAAMKRFEYIAKNYPNVGLDHKISIIMGETEKELKKNSSTGQSK